MARRSVPQHESPRVERLLRSLVGVTDLQMTWRDGVLADVHILRDTAVQHHQIVRNVLSGLRAGFGVALDSDSVFVHDTAEMFGEATFAAVPVQPAEPGAKRAESGPRSQITGDAVAPSANGGNGTPNGHGKVRGARPAVSDSLTAGRLDARGGNGERAEAAATDPAVAITARTARKRGSRLAAPAATPALVVPASAVAEPVPAVERQAGTVLQLERIDVERNTALLRCRAVLQGDGIRYSAIAEAPYTASAEAELAARVTLDAMRAGSLTCATLDGVGVVTIAATRFVVASVRSGSAVSPRAGSAVLVDSMAWAAALAVLDAVGKLEPELMERRTTAPVS